ncbi:MAG TPA: YqgE/AlgH family protein, partial [Saprospiraceae bacterium]|nr:YqgE/AlgH family protein [Saprospiraceae bacterium]
MDNLGAGKLLVAEPFMMDSVFKRTVLLLCEHDQKLGSIGYILNKPLEVKLKNLIPELSDFNVPVHYGGPVATDTLHYVHTKGDVLDNSVDLGDGVYWGGDFSKLVFLIENKIITRKDIKFFLGYSGWSE